MEVDKTLFSQKSYKPKKPSHPLNALSKPLSQTSLY